jgi:hypothetical protein
MLIEFLTHETNGPYFFALCFLLILFAIEVLGLLIGMGLSHAFDSLIDFDVDTDIGGHLSLLGLGKVPFIVWLTFFFGLFAIIGYSANAISGSLLANYIPVWLSIVPVGIASFMINGFLCTVFAQVFPQFETTAVSTDTFSGRAAKVTIGDATHTKFAMGVVLDEHNTSHNIRIQAMDSDVVLNQNKQVILVEQIKDSAIWLAIPYDD